MTKKQAAGLAAIGLFIYHMIALAHDEKRWSNRRRYQANPTPANLIRLLIAEGDPNQGHRIPTVTTAPIRPCPPDPYVGRARFHEVGDRRRPRIEPKRSGGCAQRCAARGDAPPSLARFRFRTDRYPTPRAVTGRVGIGANQWPMTARRDGSCTRALQPLAN